MRDDANQVLANVELAFTHIVVQKDVNIKLGSVTYSGAAYTIGTYKECAEWQLRNGMRAKTEIVPL